jgi:uncharacterized protein
MTAFLKDQFAMHGRRIPKLAAAIFVATLVIAVPVLAEEIRGKIKSFDRTRSEIVVSDEKSDKDVTVSLSSLSKGIGKNIDFKDFRTGRRVVVDNAFVAAKIILEESESGTEAPKMTIFQEFWHNFTHNLFKPLLLFFYLGFLVPILKVELEFPYVIYQGLTIYLLLAIGWHGGEELAKLKLSSVGSIVGFMGVGFVTNFIIGVAAYLALKVMCPRMRQIDQATVAGYYGSDSAGTFVTCLGVLGTAKIALDAYMPVMLAIMEIPGCLVALYMVSRLRHNGMDALGNMPDEPGYDPSAKPLEVHVGEPGHQPKGKHERDVELELQLSLEKMEHPNVNYSNGNGNGSPKKKGGLIDGKLLHEVFLNTGLYLLFGGIVIGLLSGLQGEKVTRDDDNFFVTLFQGVLCLFLLEMGMTASRKLKDLASGGPGFIAFALLAPNVFATFGIIVVHIFSHATGTHFELGSYVLFAVLCAAASYIAVPAVQRLAIPEASPTLPLAASLGLTFSYNVTIGIPIYIVIAKEARELFPVA